MVPNLFGTRDRFLEDNFSTERVVEGDGPGGNASDGERWGATGEASLAHLPLTSCCAAQFLTGRRPVPILGPGIGDPWLSEYTKEALQI